MDESESRASNNVRLDSKVAIVTGDGRGIGFAAANALAAASAKVVVNDTDAMVIDQAVGKIRAVGSAAVDQIGTAESANACISRAIAEFGNLDILCAIATIKFATQS